MADITLLQTDQLLHFLFEMSDEYILTHARLTSLFGRYDLEKYDNKPELISMSAGGKRVRLKNFWETWPDEVVGELLLEMLEYVFENQKMQWKKKGGLETSNIGHYSREYAICRKIASRLKNYAPKNKEGKPSNVYFDKLRERIINDLDEAKFVIWICMYYFTDHKIAKKLLEKQLQGVTVEIILQDVEWNRALENEYWNKLHSVLWYPNSNEGIFHHKLCIIDGLICWQGSYNFTHKAATKNEEDSTRHEDQKEVFKFIEKFKEHKRHITNQEQFRRQIPDGEKK